MNALRFFVILAFVVACVLAVQAIESEPAKQQASEPAAAPADGARQKRWPYLGLGYAIHAPIAYHAPIATYHAPIAYAGYPAYHSLYHALW